MKRYRIGLALQIIGLIYEVFVIIISNDSVGIFVSSNVPTTIIPGVILIVVGLFVKGNKPNN